MHKIYSFEELKALFVDYSNQNVINDNPVNLYHPVNYIMNLPGKRIRPLISLLVANAYSEHLEPILPMAYAIEMFHNFTLVHDDIMDNADLRRSNPTVHIKFGTNNAILSGDLMMIKSYDHLLSTNFDSELKFKILRLFTDTAIKVCEGQQYDMDFESLDIVSMSEYMNMIELKTAVLLAGAFKAGAVATKASEKDSEHFYQYGLNLGLAFQIQDDFLDIFGNPENFGKKTGGDIIQRKKNYLYIKALELTDNKNSISDIYNDCEMPEKEKIETMISIYKSLDIPQLTEKQILHFANEAEMHLNSVSLPKENLSEIIKLEKALLKRSI